MLVAEGQSQSTDFDTFYRLPQIGLRIWNTFDIWSSAGVFTLLDATTDPKIWPSSCEGSHAEMFKASNVIQFLVLRPYLHYGQLIIFRKIFSFY